MSKDRVTLMAAAAEVIWILGWMAVSLCAVVHSVVFARSSHRDIMGETLPIRRVFRSRPWCRAVLLYIGVLLLGIAVSGSVLRTFISTPGWFEGGLFVLVVSLTANMLIHLWHVGS